MPAAVCNEFSAGIGGGSTGRYTTLTPTADKVVSSKWPFPSASRPTAAAKLTIAVTDASGNKKSYVRAIHIPKKRAG